MTTAGTITKIFPIEGLMPQHRHICFWLDTGLTVLEFQCWGQRMNDIADFSMGDKVDVEFELVGNLGNSSLKGRKVYYTNLYATKITHFKSDIDELVAKLVELSKME